jgi:hypothetical protein
MAAIKELKLEQRQVLEALCLIHDTTPKEVMNEQTLDRCRRKTEGYDELSKEMRKKLGKEDKCQVNGNQY